jgi:hypothetical protein
VAGKPRRSDAVAAKPGCTGGHRIGPPVLFVIAALDGPRSSSWSTCGQTAGEHSQLVGDLLLTRPLTRPQSSGAVPHGAGVSPSVPRRSANLHELISVQPRRELVSRKATTAVTDPLCPPERVNMTLETHNAERKLWGLSLILAPALFATSTFFWVHTNGRVEYGAIGGTIIAIATVFWIPAFLGLFDLVKERMPRYATWGLLVAIYGCIGGASFGLEGLFAEAFAIPHNVRREAWAQFPATFNLTFFWPGPLFPLSRSSLPVSL